MTENKNKILKSSYGRNKTCLIYRYFSSNSHQKCN
nr:MAG TPA: hypothetical protein [Caudoviricetes sp.]